MEKPRKERKPLELELSSHLTPLGQANQLATILGFPQRGYFEGRDYHANVHSRLRRAANKLGILMDIERISRYREHKMRGDHEQAALTLSELIQKLGSEKKILRIEWRKLKLYDIAASLEKSLNN